MTTRKIFQSDDYTITLTETNQFKAEGPDLRGGGQDFDTYAQAIAKIEAVTGAAAKRSKRKLALPVLHGSGVAVSLTGLHATQGVFLVSPKLERNSYGARNGGDDFFPDVPVVRELLNRVKHLQAQLDATNKKLEMLEVKEVGWHIRDADYDKALDNLVAQHAEVTAKAEAMTIAEAPIEVKAAE